MVVVFVFILSSILSASNNGVFRFPAPAIVYYEISVFLFCMAITAFICSLYCEPR